MSKSNNPFYNKAKTVKDAYPRALANFMFREIIEDAHNKYNISSEDMVLMNKRAMNRAAAFFEIMDDPELYEAFIIYVFGAWEWDAAEKTEEIEEILHGLRNLD